MIEPSGPEQSTTPSIPNAAATQSAAADGPTKPLTSEEQMALYEQDLKENDWGHQPC